MMENPISSKSFSLQVLSPSSKIRPRAWQIQLINLIHRRLTNKSLKEKDILVHAGPGAGKTLGALLSFKSMKEKGYLKKFLVFCHRNSIINQWKKSSELLGLYLEDIESLNCQVQNIKNLDGIILTYQGATRNLNSIKEKIYKWHEDSFFSIADEVHHLGMNPDEPNSQAWGETFLQITRQSKLRIGLTGTPFRADNLAFCAARKIKIKGEKDLIEQINPDLCIEPRELISVGDVRPLEFHFQDGWVEHRREGIPNIDVSPLSKELRESWRARNLRRAIRISDSSCIAIQVILRARKKLEKIRNYHKNAAGLVIGRDIEHATSIANILKEDGDSVELVHSQDNNSNKVLAGFESSKTKWLVSVDMCSEGFDAPRIRVVAYLTTVVTKSRFLQGITRAVRVSDERTEVEGIPRSSSHVFAPADPLLIDYAREWSISKPYLIKGEKPVSSLENNFGATNGPLLPMETINDGVGALIKMRTAELPEFLKR